MTTPGRVARELRVHCWEGYETPPMVAPFTARHGVEVTGEALISDAQAARRVAAGDGGGFDVLNINNAYVRDYLHPRRCIQPLSPALAAEAHQGLLPGFERQYGWMRGAGGEQLGICQRFGAFNLVINTRRLSVESAVDQGFELANESANSGAAGLPFGILGYEDFNLFHVAIGAGLNPFEPLDARNMARFEATARAWFGAARLVSDDHHALNAALVAGDIAFYVSGGVYTASPARLAGHGEVRAVTPARGPIDGLGGIAFTEVTSLLARDELHPLGEAFLHYLLEPETALRAATVSGTCNPVAQMGDPKVWAGFTRAQLDAIQFETLADDMARSADYRLLPDHDALLTALRAARAAWP